MMESNLTPLQQEMMGTVCRYPCRLSRSGLAKMLVGAKSWVGRECPEYGRSQSIVVKIFCIKLI